MQEASVFPMLRQSIASVLVIVLYAPSVCRDGAASDVGVTQCIDCGHTGCCEKVCRLEKEEKKISVTCWGSKCEYFCLPGPSCQCCGHCEEVCKECEPKISSASRTLRWYHWIPGRPEGLATKKKLMRKTVTKILPSFKWVVVDLCPNCVHEHVPPEVPEGVKLPLPPQASGKVLGAVP